MLESTDSLARYVFTTANSPSADSGMSKFETKERAMLTNGSLVVYGAVHPSDKKTTFQIQSYSIFRCVTEAYMNTYTAVPTSLRSLLTMQMESFMIGSWCFSEIIIGRVVTWFREGVKARVHRSVFATATDAET